MAQVQVGLAGYFETAAKIHRYVPELRSPSVFVNTISSIPVTHG